MYSIEEIQRLQTDEEFLIDEGDKFCLISPIGREITEDIVSNQAKFCVIQTINAYKENKIGKDLANYIINKIDAIVYSIDMLGCERVIQKLNVEVIQEELFTPHFDYICILCDELYVSFE